ncbi:zinc ABC transporter substrate-binding protein [Phormidium pseudopriestleyi FRX01]|uniref:Zinc ABC transporter substrate-binding protein n=1 Tax=Phormidium pseudopriestleyi FRX01 TaxID=1759528 RepID=A0ABS3FST0_9CYAN|nr:zinc ABC transporter substrate-binding protein [Phormidium pseudopriestleyi]MBO0350175.1 zinc ABC transporter substrate-binding protein [Phormidium pseudopriestleyi FRX01]
MFNRINRKIQRLCGATLTTAVLGLTGWAIALSVNPPTSAQEKPRVVASYSVLCDLAEQIARDRIALTCLIEGGQDPHTYQPRPQDLRAIETAQLILYGGYDFEPAIVQIVQNTRNSAPKIAIHEVAVPNPILGEDHHEHSHSHGDEEVADPHVWHDVRNGIRMAEAIGNSLKQIDPGNADFYRQNINNIRGELEQLHTWIQAQVATIPPNQRVLVTTHDALGYYAQAYNFRVAESLMGVSTSEQPNAARFRELVELIRAEGVPTVFVEVTSNDRVMNNLAREANVQIAPRALMADGLGPRGSNTGTYVQMLTSNTCIIVTGLGGQCTPFPGSASRP